MILRSLKTSASRRTLTISAGLLAALLMERPDASGQVLQLPTFQYFATDSSALVPDRGGAMLGGVGRSSSGSNQFGPPFVSPNRSYGGQSSTGGMSVTAQIHDMSAMDESVLRGPSAKARPGNMILRDAPRIAENADIAPSGDAPRGSVAELAARNAAQQAAQARAEQVEAQKLFDRGLKAETDGKAGLAKVYFQMASRRATGELKQQIAAALAKNGTVASQPAALRTGVARHVEPGDARREPPADR